jgi:class 3 adenylate cyclase/tetratricopeptide (TPR) repeat protein
MNCAACGTENPASARFCVGCGAGLAARCPSCQADLPAGARFCPACGKPTKLAADSQPAAAQSPGQRKQVTVLFADFAGFTAFVHKQDAEDVRDYMSSVWEKLDSIIVAHGGLIEKHIGDAIMAVFGAKQAREDDPVQAVRAGLAMQAWLTELRPEGARPGLQMRIGIHTGVVVVGPLGSTGEFAATGDTVNLANRLEASAPLGGVLISHETYRLIFGFFDVQGLEPFSVKGRPELVQTYLVLQAKPRALAVQLRGVEGVETEMIGRKAELERLKATLQRVLGDNETRMITIVGDAGVGKSCLLREFQKWIEPLPHAIRLFHGRATPEMAGLPFSLMRDVFCARFEIQDSDPPVVAREKLERGIAGLLKRDGSRESPELMAHFIGQLLGLDFSASPDLRDILGDPDQVRQRAFHCFTRFFTTVSRRGPRPVPDIPARPLTPGEGSGGDPHPLHAHSSAAPGLERPGTPAGFGGAFLVAEDLHWSDEGSLELLAHLARTCSRAPLLILCLARPDFLERRPDWGQSLAGQERISLGPLSRTESLTLVESILRKTPEIPQALRELIVGGAEGIPFYIEEIVKMLIDQKVIVPGPEAWSVEPARLAAARVPSTLTGVLQARLDDLLPMERLVLQRASVVGRIFWDTVLERLSAPGPLAEADEEGGPLPASEISADASSLARTRGEVQEALTGLRRKELILRAESSAFAGATEYGFKHELLRNVAYESVLKKVRRKHHGQAARWLLEQSGERSNEFAGMVAAHFEQAGRLVEAADWYGRAGQQARRGYAPSTAIEYFRKALSLRPAATDSRDVQNRLEWHEGLSEALGAQARFAEALEVCEAMRALAETLGDLAAQARAWNGLAFLNERLGKNRVSVDCAERAEALARAAGSTGRGERIRALHLKGWAFYRLSDAPAVLALGDQTLGLCLELGNRPGLATSYKLHGVAHLQLGHYGEAVHFFEQGLALYQELGDRRNTAAMWNNLGETARSRGDFLAAEGLYQKALAEVRQIGHRESEVIYLTNLSGARLGLRKFAQVEADAREAIALTAGANSCALSATYSFLSEACLAQGKKDEALDSAKRALALAQESENDLDLGTAWRTLGQAVEGEPGIVGGASAVPDPAACYTESLCIFDRIHAEGEQARTLAVWAQFEHRQDRPEAAQQKSEAARAILVRLGALPAAGN